MKTALSTLLRKIKDLEPYKGEIILFAGERVPADDVIKEHIEVIDLIERHLELKKMMEEFEKVCKKSFDAGSRLSDEVKKIKENYDLNGFTAKEFVDAINKLTISNPKDWNMDKKPVKTSK